MQGDAVFYETIKSPPRDWQVILHRCKFQFNHGAEGRKKSWTMGDERADNELTNGPMWEKES
eukprot:scaffold17120_cov36-Cyclotella_meneghiniana.AAC.3